MSIPELPKYPRLAVIFSWSDASGENDYASTTPVPQPVTVEGIQELASNMAKQIGQLLVVEGVIPKPEQKPEA